MNNYSEEFKAQALQLFYEIVASKAAQDLGIPYGTLADWRKNKNRCKRKEKTKAQLITESE